MQRTAGEPLTVRTTPLAVRVIRSYQLYLLLLPTIARVFIFQYVPMYGVTIAFKNFKPHLASSAATGSACATSSVSSSRRASGG